MASNIRVSKYKFKRNEDGSYQVLEETSPHITGTYFGAIMGVSQWQTPFTAACQMLGLYKEYIDDVPAVHAGVVLESKILEHYAHEGVIPADQVYAERRGEHNGWKQDFDDPIFGGHVDGVTEDGGVVEVKTTSSPEVWLQGIPEHYWLQASLYAYHLGAPNIKFLVGFVDQETLKNPYKWNPEGNTAEYNVGLHPKTEEYLEVARKWFADYIGQGKTPIPDMSNPKDVAVVEALNAQLMTEQEVFDLISEYEICQERIKAVDPMVKRADEIKGLLLLYAEAQNVPVIVGLNSAYKLTDSTRTIVDTDALKRDGLYDKYLKESKSKGLRKTKM